MERLPFGWNWCPDCVQVLQQGRFTQIECSSCGRYFYQEEEGTRFELAEHRPTQAWRARFRGSSAVANAVKHAGVRGLTFREVSTCLRSFFTPSSVRDKYLRGWVDEAISLGLIRVWVRDADARYVSTEEK